MKRLAKIAGGILLYLVAFDVAGLVLVFVLDVLSLSFMALYYSIWFVAGVFCGLLSYGSCGGLASTPDQSEESKKPGTDWTSRADAEKAGRIAVLMTGVIVLPLAVVFYPFSWRSGPDPSGFVPDNGGLTIVYLGTVLATSIFAHKSLRPQKVKSR